MNWNEYISEEKWINHLTVLYRIKDIEEIPNTSEIATNGNIKVALYEIQLDPQKLNNKKSYGQDWIPKEVLIKINPNDPLSIWNPNWMAKQ